VGRRHNFKCVKLCLFSIRAFRYESSDLDVCGLLGFPSGEFGPAVISLIGAEPEITTMKTLTLAAIRCSLIFTAVAALSIAYPVSVQAVPTTYQYTGNPFTDVRAPYTTSDFLTAMVTLAGPLGANMPLTNVTPTAFTLTDGVQTISNLNAMFFLFFQFATDATGAISEWEVFVSTVDFGQILTRNILNDANPEEDHTVDPSGGFGENFNDPEQWRARDNVPDAGSTLSMMTLTLMALGLVARRFQRAAA